MSLERVSKDGCSAVKKDAEVTRFFSLPKSIIDIGIKMLSDDMPKNLNVSSGMSCTLEKFIAKAEEAMDLKFNLKKRDFEVGEICESELDNSLLIQYLGLPKVLFENQLEGFLLSFKNSKAKFLSKE